jgi:hypothetical protein
MAKHVVVLLATEEGRQTVRRRCRAEGVKISIFEELVDAELEQTGKKRKKGLWERFDDVLDRMDEDT